MWIHRIAKSYGSDPYTVAGWAPERLAFAVATLRLAKERVVDMAARTNAMAVVDVGD